MSNANVLFLKVQSLMTYLNMHPLIQSKDNKLLKNISSDFNIDIYLPYNELSGKLSRKIFLYIMYNNIIRLFKLCHLFKNGVRGLRLFYFVVFYLIPSMIVEFKNLLNYLCDYAKSKKIDFISQEYINRLNSLLTALNKNKFDKYLQKESLLLLT